MTKETIFWLDNYEGKSYGGIFIRNDLFKFFETLREKGINPVGIKCDDSWNLEIIVDKLP